MTATLFDELFDDDSFGDESSAGSRTGVVPERAVTFVHTADWQLGMTRHFLAPEAQAQFTADRLAGISRIGAIAAEVGAEFVVVCGDVFDDHRVSSRIITQALDRLREFAMPVYLLPGNHDPLDVASVYRSGVFAKACPPGVTVLSTPGVREVADGVDLVVAPWPTKSPSNDLIAEQVRRLGSDDRIRIVVGHGGVDRLSPNPDPAIIAVDPLETALRENLIDFVALGDRHSVTDLGDSGRIWYSGAPEVTDFDNVEKASGAVLSVSLTRGQRPSVAVAEHEVGKWCFRSLTAEVDGADDIAALSATLDAVPAKATTAVRLGLVGRLSVADDAALGELLETAADRFAALVRWESRDDVAVTADPEDVAAMGLRGYAAEAADELVAQANSGDESAAAIARHALALLGRLAGGAR
ncbi:exonuclease SbcCD subunit D [Gordonia defluvii]|jgi:DNA repair exonuclease SbcCD nuclease subunit|uniref:Nuclease SbcCD subunit D n=1 Tax=Gordonia defluvii TaxID=283718 RepID=A0ABP6LKQ0_9ACTN|nr:exonuclease SbcCD subunit D [Gordonia sp. UBA5067]